jgi:predicted TIM-barrel fold metal-dependent hydrolase
MKAVRRIRDLARRYPNVRSISISPHMLYPFIAPNDREYFPIYVAAIEERLAMFMNVGFPAPRVPASTQDPIHLDDVCWFFPELTVVMRHGGEPWVSTCVKMLCGGRTCTTPRQRSPRGTTRRRYCTCCGRAAQTR